MWNGFSSHGKYSGKLILGGKISREMILEYLQSTRIHLGLIRRFLAQIVRSGTEVKIYLLTEVHEIKYSSLASASLKDF
jgi:hypothetical protein